MNEKLLNILSLAFGILFGVSAAWFSLKDRMTKEIEEQVTERVTTATRLARLEERLKALDARTLSPTTP